MPCLIYISNYSYVNIKGSKKNPTLFFSENIMPNC